MSAVDAEKADSATESGRVLVDAVRAGRTARQMMTREDLRMRLLWSWPWWFNQCRAAPAGDCPRCRG